MANPIRINVTVPPAMKLTLSQARELAGRLMAEHEGHWVERPRGWECENYHHNPDTGRNYLNAPERITCEICTRPRPR